MSAECSAYGVCEAARELQFCDRHGEDEIVLLLKEGNLDRKPNEVELLTRFVQGIKEHTWSSAGTPQPATSQS